ncbi:hypothetical protein B0H16DRAFT_1570568 [Mycena metata]|uniref:DUF6699 domain-containing protein n=1 Tax=Mycena metata TaxID=1033252 RepID=A0AAD7IBY1_9AGAR|nr:hypothetical protein B0H16DRAFT_1570568 [Mycena metata]
MYSSPSYTYAPRMNPVSLPAMSPPPGSAIPHRFSSQPWPTSYQTTVTNFPRFDEHQLTRSHSSASSHASAPFIPSIHYASGGRAASGSHAESRPRAERTTSAAAPAPLKSILKSSRTRSHSVSSNPEASNNVPPARAERGSSNLSKSTVTVHTTAPLKAEAISLSWPLIRFDPRRPDRPLLYFDAGFDPRLPKNLKSKKGWESVLWLMSEADRNLPVSTHCTLTKMVIHCPEISEIVVKRSRGIRCVDVFTAIYDAYHVHLRRDELPRNMRRYVGAFEQRCEDDDRSTEAERRGGMRRVDLLRGKRIFDGLSRHGADWKLEFHVPQP